MSARDGFFKDRGVGRDAPDTVVLDESSEFSGKQQLSADEVVPDALPVLLSRARGGGPEARWGLLAVRPRLAGSAGQPAVGGVPFRYKMPLRDAFGEGLRRFPSGIFLGTGPRGQVDLPVKV
ncbi:hypothetical protein MK280_04320, partial [Myxococcota bacterium]|nr:hypothetical protein [Myxococcota bacterium]